MGARPAARWPRVAWARRDDGGYAAALGGARAEVARAATDDAGGEAWYSRVWDDADRPAVEAPDYEMAHASAAAAKRSARGALLLAARRRAEEEAGRG